MTKGYFITGTDTDCGKTEVTLGLMYRLQRQGRTVVGMKPVASGAGATPEGLRNGDALRLQHAGSIMLDYELINPYAFEPPIAPHLAARQAGVRISLQRLSQAYKQLSLRADVVLVEGVGGWRVPLVDRLAVSDLAQLLGLPVILVVGMKLGCINHALLTAESILAAGHKLAGWVANTVDPEMLNREDNIRDLKSLLPVPLLGTVPWLDGVDPVEFSQYLQLN